MSCTYRRTQVQYSTAPNSMVLGTRIPIAEESMCHNPIQSCIRNAEFNLTSFYVFHIKVHSVHKRSFGSARTDRADHADS